MSIAGPMASMRKRPLSSIALNVWSRAILSLFAAAFELMSVRPFECPRVAAGVSPRLSGSRTRQKSIQTGLVGWGGE